MSEWRNERKKNERKRYIKTKGQKHTEEKINYKGEDKFGDK